MFLKTLAATLTGIAAAAALAACGPQARGTVEIMSGDSFIGPADAKVTIIEYGAPTCPGCKKWHDDNWAQVKATYIDTGKAKFIFREFPSHNPPVDSAIFAMARCAGQADYFPLIDEAFAKQMDIEVASQKGEVIPELKKLGAKFRLSGDQVESCIKDPKNLQRIFDVREEAGSRGVHSTPTFYINDREVQDFSFGGFKTQLDMVISGEPAPAPAAPAPDAAAPAPAAPAPAAPH